MANMGVYDDSVLKMLAKECPTKKALRIAWLIIIVRQFVTPVRKLKIESLCSSWEVSSEVVKFLRKLESCHWSRRIVTEVRNFIGSFPTSIVLSNLIENFPTSSANFQLLLELSKFIISFRTYNFPTSCPYQLLFPITGILTWSYNLKTEMSSQKSFLQTISGKTQADSLMW